MKGNKKDHSNRNDWYPQPGPIQIPLSYSKIKNLLLPSHPDKT